MSTTNKEEKVAECQYREYIPAERKSATEKAIPFGLQHVLAMFVSNLAPVLIVCSAALVKRNRGTFDFSRDHTAFTMCYVRGRYRNMYDSYIRCGRSGLGFRLFMGSQL